MPSKFQQITLPSLQEWIDQGVDFELIDVREASEHQAFNIGGRLIPLGTIMQHTDTLPEGKPIVVYCKRGIRSQIAIQRWAQRVELDFYNLQGGIYSELRKQ